MSRASAAPVRNKISPTTIDEYLALVSEDKRAALQALRMVIRAVAPDAEECISYQIPAFRLNGMLVGFAAAKTHCSLYAWNGSAVGMFADELKEFDTSKGTIRFTSDRPLPESLVRQLVEMKVAKNAARSKAAKSKPTR
jgi:uncharacterized protein YdhG (YjbR/CyaY superfamily)